MSNTILTTAGRALIAAAQAEDGRLGVDRLIFGYREGLDSAVAPGADFALAASEVKHTETGLTAGLAAADCAVWSAVLPPTVGDFSFNVVALAAGETVVAVAVQYVQHKIKTSGFVIGNTIIKNFALQVVNVSDLTGITVNAATWQQELSGLFAALNHNHDDRYSGKNHTHPYEPAGAVSTHNSAGDPHPGKFAGANHLHDGRYAPASHTHPYEPGGAVGSHNTSASAHTDIRNALNGKANTALSNLTPAAVGNLGFIGTHAVAGYQKLPGGLILQWGVTGIGSKNGNQRREEVFPVTFPSACYNVTVSPYEPDAITDSNLGNHVAGIISYTRIGFVWADDRVHDATIGIGASWIAIGK